VKFSSVYTYMCFQQVFENTIPGRKSHCRWVLNSASCEIQLPPIIFFQPIQGHVMWLATHGSREGVYDNEIKTHNSVTIENITILILSFWTKKKY